MVREDPQQQQAQQPPAKKQHTSSGVIFDGKPHHLANGKMEAAAALWATEIKNERHNDASIKDGHIEYTGYAHAPLVYVDAPAAKQADDAMRNSNNRKRQLPVSPTGSVQFPRGNVPFTDFKLDFAGYEMGSAGPAMLPPPRGANAQQQYAGPDVENPHEVLEFLKSLNLTIRLDPMLLNQAADKLLYYGFDTVVALAFATMDDLQHCGLQNVVDYQVVYQQSRRELTARHFQGPGVLSNSYTVSRWLMLCGIPKKHAFEYTERLCRLGYPSVTEFELIMHDERALSEFRIGHRRLFIHCVTIAINQSQHQPQSFSHGTSSNAHHMNHHHYGATVYDAGSSSTLVQPLEIHRENEFDSFLDALIDPSADPRYGAGSNAVDSYHHHHHHHHHGAHVSEHSGDSDDGGEYGGPSDFFRAATGSADHMLMSMNYHNDDVNGAGSAVAMRNLPYDVVQLLYEAVNMPRPNPCRRGKKIYWSVLANNGMKEERFAVLENYTAAELQNAYLRQFELPSNNPVKTDAWSEENIHQLENAVKDPRCRHLSKVCWEMLATGRTGVEEYAPLAKFTASQLRSRFRSLFGDKRPQKLRQKKQMLKMQQQENLKKV
ncbi:hypothetical protein FI667_g12804, partial [Globisporangium splendens]